MINNVFVNLAFVFIIASIFGFIARALKQPKIPFYVLAGLLMGPFGYNLAYKYGLISFFSYKSVGTNCLICLLSGFSTPKELSTVTSKNLTTHAMSRIKP